MPKRKLTTGALRETLIKAIDDVMTGDLNEQKASAVAKLAAQVNNSLLAEVEIMRADIVGKLEGRSLGLLSIGDDDEAKTIEHDEKSPASPMIAAPAKGPEHKDRPPIKRTTSYFDRPVAPGSSHDFGDPPPGRSALDQRIAEESKA